MHAERLLLASIMLHGCRNAESPSSLELAAPIEHSSEPPAPTPPEPEFHWKRSYLSDESAGVFAVVPYGAMLYRTPRFEQRGWAYQGSDGVARVLAVEGDVVEIELDWESAEGVQHCVWGSAANLGLRVFIHRDQLADLTSEGQSIELGVDEGINAAPGVLVDRRSKRLRADPSFSLDVDPQLLAIGKFYTPARLDSVPVPLRENAAGVLTYGDRQQLCFAAHGPHVYERSVSDPPRALVGIGCLQVAGPVRINPPDTACSSGLGGGGIGCGRMWGDAWIVAAGTELTWSKGGHAGRVHRELRIWEKPRVRGDVACFNPEWPCESVELFRVCVPSSAVTYAPIERPDWAQGSLQGLE